MLTVVRSQNVQSRFPVYPVVAKAASVVYDGPFVRQAVVVWSCKSFVVSGSGFGQTAVGFKLSGGSTSAPLLLTEAYNSVVGQVVTFGGALVLDLEPGVVLELWLYEFGAVGFDLAANGFTVSVL